MFRFSFHWQALTVAAVIPIAQLDFSKKLPAPPKHYGVFADDADFQSFCEPEKLGSH